MGLFKDFKDDFSVAMGEMVPSNEVNEETDAGDNMVNTIADSVDVNSELNKLDGLLEKAAQNMDYEEAGEEVDTIGDTTDTSVEEADEGESFMDTTTHKEETKTFDAPASDENAVITGGMTINGDLESTGSIAVEGRINGNVSCNGKLTVTGTIEGDCTSSEFFADSARIKGQIVANGTVKVGAGSMVIGNIKATSAVIAGAVQGDIDVQGPVVVDTSAVVMGTVKSRTVQINNGAVIEGYCSQAYSDVDVSTVFNTK